jgi:hypothetical protein
LRHAGGLRIADAWYGVRGATSHGFLTVLGIEKNPPLVLLD